MLCEHLRALEQALIDAGIKENWRGEAWSKNCREWAYFNCVLDRPALRQRFALPDFVEDHEHLGTHSGQEAGFACRTCNDGIMGNHPKRPEGPVFS